jgi:hypothetical protein
MTRKSSRPAPVQHPDRPIPRPLQQVCAAPAIHSCASHARVPSFPSDSRPQTLRTGARHRERGLFSSDAFSLALPSSSLAPVPVSGTSQGRVPYDRRRDPSLCSIGLASVAPPSQISFHARPLRIRRRSHPSSTQAHPVSAPPHTARTNRAQARAQPQRRRPRPTAGPSDTGKPYIR